MIVRRQRLIPEEDVEAVEPEESRGRRFESSYVRGNRC
jgi:hypothetical protein